LPNKSSDFN